MGDDREDIEDEIGNALEVSQTPYRALNPMLIAYRWTDVNRFFGQAVPSDTARAKGYQSYPLWPNRLHVAVIAINHQ
jgi:hypothetical protein